MTAYVGPAAPLTDAGVSKANWLARLVATLGAAYPHATIKADTHAAGGLAAKTLTSCPDDKLCASSRLDRLCPDLLILDFALGLGFPSTLTSVELLLRFATKRNIASVVLALPDWCSHLPQARELQSHVGAPPWYGHRAPRGSALARHLCVLRRARAPGSSVQLGTPREEAQPLRAPPCTASAAQASCLQSRQFHRL